MKVEYTHKGYKYVWSDGESKAFDMGSSWVYDKYGNLLIHATTNSTPPTEKDAIEDIELTIAMLERFSKKLDEWIMLGGVDTETVHSSKGEIKLPKGVFYKIYNDDEE